MAQFSQTHRLFQVTTPFGADTLLFGRMQATERLSQPFEFIVTAFSERGDLDADTILGKPVTVKIATQEAPPRYFQGLAADFTLVDYSEQLYEYRVALRPWLWFLTQTADCRTFLNKSVPDIVQEVCKQAGFTDLRLSLSGSYDPWEYCVQFRETDFNFVSRLLEQEGIFYFFEHSASKHELVLCDDAAQLTTAPSCETVPFLPDSGMNRLTAEIDHLSSWSRRKSLRPGTYAARQFEFKTPAPVLAGTATISRGYDLSRFETFDFPALAATPSSAAVQKVAQLRVQELQTGQTSARGAGNAAGLTTGTVFTLEQHPSADLNVRWLVSSTTIEMSNSGYLATAQSSASEFKIAIEALLASEPYRPARITPKPLVHGLQSAIVVGPKGSEICTDEFGRIKVQFHWDRQGKLDENSSCWIRVAQTWAGKGWGALRLPRIGQEVMVAFMDGDPDRPVVVGSVYNGTNKPPYSLPGNATQSGVKSRSSTHGTSGNEIRFEDSKGSEQLVFQAEKDHQVVVKHDASSSVGNDMSSSIGNDMTVSVKGSQISDTGTSLVVKAGTSITFSTGLASLTLSAAGIVEISGMMVTINGEAAVNIAAAAGLIKGPIVIPP
ncbi:MAG: Rhs element Vgr protein [Gammaproteobacteria bacterium]|nr:Rhs element Vgr protein [Gammaproteobacteria bacterium]